jgi:quercetin dioxygenase-like cupin family protein
MSSNLSCNSINQEKFLDYDFDTIVINGFSIKNDDSDIIFVPGETYLFPTYSAYGHALVDVFAQFKVLQLKYKNIKPFFYEQSDKGFFFNERILKDQMSVLGYDQSIVKDISRGNYLFEKVILFFDMNNTFPEEFYKNNGAKRSSHYFPFCDCYQGTEPCGESKYFKYNYLAIDMLKESFSHLFKTEKTEKFFISRERYNKKYQDQISFYSNKEFLSDEEKLIYHVAKVRSTPKEKYIEELFKDNGYTIIYAEDYSLSEQIKLFSSAKVIASISGTGLFNTFWCDSQTKVLEILAVPNYKYHYKEFSEYAGTNHSYIDVRDLSDEETVIKVKRFIIKAKEMKSITVLQDTLNSPKIDLSVLEKARAEKRIHIFKDAFPELPSWDTILNVIAKYVEEDLERFPDRSYLSNSSLENEYLDMRLKCRFWSRLAFQLYDPSDPFMTIIPELKPVTDWVLENYPSEIYQGNFGLVTFMKNKGVVGSKHSDYVDQFQWVVQGEMIWRTGDNLENETHVVAGDFVFVPKDLVHEVETFKAPRAAINVILHVDDIKK